MSLVTRRQFMLKAIISSAAVSAVAPRIGRFGEASALSPADAPRTVNFAVIEDTIFRLGGDASFGSITWTTDDRQLVPVLDGAGWPERPVRHFYSSRVFALTGGPKAPTFSDCPGYPDIPLSDIYKGLPPYYGFTLLAVGNRIYNFLSTSTMDVVDAQLHDKDDFRFNAVKLIYSDDDGSTWRNQDGSTPVIRETYRDLSGKTMVFIREPEDAFALLSFLQMGPGYNANRDGYVYVYSPGKQFDFIQGKQLDMFRAPTAALLQRSAYEFFKGRRPDGSAEWTKDINARGPVHTYGGFPSVVYNAPLDVYVMAMAVRGAKDGSDRTVANLTLWVASNPWGPWEQIRTKPWTPGSDPEARLDSPTLVPKWTSEDGKTMWLMWSDVGERSWNGRKPPKQEILMACRSVRDDVAFQGRLQYHRYYPYYGFNLQRIDLDVT